MMALHGAHRSHSTATAARRLWAPSLAIDSDDNLHVTYL